MATALANGTLRAAIPGLGVENLGEWRGELNLMLPKDAVTAYSTTKLAALNHDWSKALGCGRHCRIPLQKLTGGPLAGRPIQRRVRRRPLVQRSSIPFGTLHRELL